jgi:hypothetical protein
LIWCVSKTIKRGEEKIGCSIRCIKGMLALVMHRFKENEFAKKKSLQKRNCCNTTPTMECRLENMNGYYWYRWLKTQAHLLKLSEIDKYKKTINELKVWLLKR